MYTRTRTRGQFGNVSVGTRFWTTPATPTTTTTTRANTLGRTEEFHDVTIPGAHRLMKQGTIINSPMKKLVIEYSGTGNGFRMRNPTAVPGQTQYYEADGDYAMVQLGPPSHGLAFDPNLRDALIQEAATAALARVAAPSAELMVTAAEFKKTVDMLISPCRALSASVSRAVTRFNRKQKLPGNKRIAEAHDVLASVWLEGRYGWRPLMADIDNIKDAITRVYPPRQTARATRTSRLETVRYEQQAFNGLLSTSGMTRVTINETTVRAYCLYDWLASLLDSQAAFGLRVSDIPSAMWELVPYSFVVDWFVNTSAFIKALSPRGEIRRLAEGWVVTDSLYTVRNIPAMSYIGGTPGWVIDQHCNATHATLNLEQFRVPERLPVALQVKHEWSAWTKDLRAFDAFFLLSQAMANSVRKGAK